MNGEPQLNRESRIREAAYFIWESEGRPDGEAERHWSAAEQRLDSEAERETTSDRASEAGRAGAQRSSS